MGGVRLTARGAIALVFVVTLAAGVTGSPAIVGAAFIVACLAAVMLIQPRELLALVVTPPLVFFLATLGNELVRSLGAASFTQAFGLGMFTALSTGAPWLFVGSALVLVFAWFRGLPANVRELRDELRAARPARPERAARSAGSARALGATQVRPKRSVRPEGRKDTGEPREPDVPRPRRGGRPGYAPEPEGYFEPRVYGSTRDN